MTMRVFTESFENFEEKVFDLICRFLYGLFGIAQFFFPALGIYGIIEIINQNIIGIIWMILGFFCSWALFAAIAHEESKTIFRKINNKFHLFGWEESNGAKK